MAVFPHGMTFMSELWPVKMLWKTTSHSGWWTKTFTFTFIHLADAFIHSDLQLLYM